MSSDEQLRSCNIQIVTCSTTSNVFHALRRQLLRDYRKPLIMFNSKRLLKFKGANRPLSEIEEGTEFQPVYGDESGNPASGVKKVLICNGQFYYELRSKRDELQRKVNITLFRILQLSESSRLHPSLLKSSRKFYQPTARMLMFIGCKRSMRIMELGHLYTPG